MPSKDAIIMEVEQWLVRNGYRRNFATDYYQKIATFSTSQIQSVVYDEDLLNDYKKVIKEVESWHKFYSLSCTWWPDDLSKFYGDDTTKKIEVDIWGNPIQPTDSSCQHEPGQTPLTNSQNELCIICRKCGIDLKVIKK
jgi:hypothetical protein